jgi:urea transporter
MELDEFVKMHLRGVSQVFFQESALAGLLFLLGILANSWVMFAGAAIGTMSGTLAAVFLRYKKTDIRRGLYGFNGCLVGCALFFFLVPDALVLLFVVAGAVLSSIIMDFMHTRKMSPFTFPFVLSTWIAFAFISATGIVAFQPIPQSVACYFDAIPSLFSSLGQVMFQGSVIAGVVFLAALAAGSLNAAAYGLMGAAAGIAASLLFGLPLALVNIGIYGYNGVLASIAFSGAKKNALLLAACAAALSTLVLFAFQSAGIIALTAPFVFSAWMVMAALKTFRAE